MALHGGALALHVLFSRRLLKEWRRREQARLRRAARRALHITLLVLAPALEGGCASNCGDSDPEADEEAVWEALPQPCGDSHGGGPGFFKRGRVAAQPSMGRHFGLELGAHCAPIQRAISIPGAPHHPHPRLPVPAVSSSSPPPAPQEVPHVREGVVGLRIFILTPRDGAMTSVVLRWCRLG